MPSPADLAGTSPVRVLLGDFAKQFQKDASPFGTVFSYHAAAVPVPAEDLADFIDEPVSALPPAILSALGHVTVYLVPFLERPVHSAGHSGKRPAKKRPATFDPSETIITGTPPAAATRLSAAFMPPENGAHEYVMAFGVRDIDSSDYHYNFFHAISLVVHSMAPDAVLAGYKDMLREELKARVHGEVDDASWKAKVALLGKESGLRGNSKLFQAYAKQSFVDTLTLFLHGICCDIDVEPGPRQIASRYLRKRLQFFQRFYPAPEGYAVFPEELKN